MAHSTKQLYKVDKDQQVHQVLSVLEAVVECGIAGICRDRHLFPDSFFISRDTGSHSSVTQFNMAVLRESDLAESQKGVPTPNSKRSSSVVSEDDLSRCNSNERINDSESKSFNHRVEKNQGSECTSVLDDSCVSPLTSSACIENPSLNSHHSPENSMTSDRHSHYSLLQAEALLLLYWVRQGVIQIMKEGKLARLVFGICKRGNGKGGNKKDESSCDADIRDRIVESYAFDISKLSKIPSRSLNQAQVNT